MFICRSSSSSNEDLTARPDSQATDTSEHERPRELSSEQQENDELFSEALE
jgi:hypothetical protein